MSKLKEFLFKLSSVCWFLSATYLVTYAAKHSNLAVLFGFNFIVALILIVALFFNLLKDEKY